MYSIKSITLIGISTFVMYSCVTQKKYDDLLSKKVGCDASLFDSEATNKNKQASIDSLSTSLKESIKNGKELRGFLDEKIVKFDRLTSDYNDLVSRSNSETGQLIKKLARKEDDLSILEKTLMKSKIQNDSLSRSLKEREAKLKELEGKLKDKDDAVKNLRNKISDALLNFNKDLTVKVQNGRVYVSVSEQLLFKSGSTEIDYKGVEALKKLGNALKNSGDINVVVEGHTDDIQLSKTTNGIKDNWDLSVLRATEITRILTSAGVEAKKITPSGRGETVPVASNKTAEDRSKNRRTEIILTPNLDDLFKILE